jgi:urease accessory protein
MRPPRNRWMPAGLALAIALGATRAEAHLVTTGLGPVYDGIGHFFLSPDDVLPAAGLALLAGMRGTEAGRRALLLLPVAWVAGGLAGLLGGAPAMSGQIPAAASFLLLGVLVAADRTLPVAMVAALAILVGGAHGFFNGLAMREAGTGPALLQLTGVGVMLFVIVAIVAAFVVSLRRPWTRIVVRVAGSWIAATGLLLLGWALRTRR